jgi:hypothetical protein
MISNKRDNLGGQRRSGVLPQEVTDTRQNWFIDAPPHQLRP